MLLYGSMSLDNEGKVPTEYFSVNEENLSSRYINEEVLADFNLENPDIEASARVTNGGQAVEQLESDFAGLRDTREVQSAEYKGPGGSFRTSVVIYPASKGQITSGFASGDVSLTEAASDIWYSTVLSLDDKGYPATRIAVSERDDGSPIYGDMIQVQADLHPSDDGADIEEVIEQTLGNQAEEFYDNQKNNFGVNHRKAPEHFELERK